MWPRLLALIFVSGCCLVSTSYAGSPAESTAATNTNTPLILVMGDSLSAGFGIDQSHGWVNLLAKRLNSEGYMYRVFNASISGETSAGGLIRLPNTLNENPSIVIIELGANDGLRGLPLDQLRNNLEKMVTLSQKVTAKVLLVGMRLPTNYGPAYIAGFHNIYLDLANKYQTGLVPFLLENVATQRNLMQEDNLHPTADAQPKLLDNVWRHLQPILK